MFRKGLAEFVGTFILVSAIAGATAATGAKELAALAIGLALGVAVYVGGHVSGGHYNPAVSFSFLLRGKLSPAEFGMYLLSQLLGGTLAAFLFSTANQVTFKVAPSQGSSSATAHYVAEIVGTFILVIVVHSVATAKKLDGNKIYGLAIGCALFVSAAAFGGISGGAFNPAVGLGPMIANIKDGFPMDLAMLYIFGPLIGAAIAVGVFSVLENEPA